MVYKIYEFNLKYRPNKNHVCAILQIIWGLENIELLH